jgi:hypothetical protein
MFDLTKAITETIDQLLASSSYFSKATLIQLVAAKAAADGLDTERIAVDVTHYLHSAAASIRPLFLSRYDEPQFFTTQEMFEFGLQLSGVLRATTQSPPHAHFAFFNHRAILEQLRADLSKIQIPPVK